MEKKKKAIKPGKLPRECFEAHFWAPGGDEDGTHLVSALSFFVDGSPENTQLLQVAVQKRVHEPSDGWRNHTYFLPGGSRWWDFPLATLLLAPDFVLAGAHPPARSCRSFFCLDTSVLAVSLSSFLLLPARCSARYVPILTVSAEVSPPPFYGFRPITGLRCSFFILAGQSGRPGGQQTGSVSVWLTGEPFHSKHNAVIQTTLFSRRGGCCTIVRTQSSTFTATFLLFFFNNQNIFSFAWDSGGAGLRNAEPKYILVI